MSSIKTDICTWPHCTHTAKDQCKGLGPRSDADTITRLEAEVERRTQKGLAYLVAIQHLTAENERLRAALVHARNQMQHPDQLIDEALSQELQQWPKVKKPPLDLRKMVENLDKEPQP